MRVVGLDPGTAWCGFAVLDVVSDFETPGVVEVGAFESDEDATIALRVRELAGDLAQLFAEHKPAAVVVETPSFGLPPSALSKLWAAYGAILGAAASAGGLLGGPLVVDRQPDAWRKALGLPTGRDLARRPELTANGRRTEHKRLSRGYVLGRFPGLPTLLASFKAEASAHAYDATAIACSWIASAGYRATSSRREENRP